MPGSVVGGAILTNTARNYRPCSRSVTQVPEASAYSAGVTVRVWLMSVTSSRSPLTLSRNTQNPLSALWNVTRSTRPLSFERRCRVDRGVLTLVAAGRDRAARPRARRVAPYAVLCPAPAWHRRLSATAGCAGRRPGARSPCRRPGASARSETPCSPAEPPGGPRGVAPAARPPDDRHSAAARAVRKNDHDVCASADDVAGVLEHVALHRLFHHIGELHATLGAALELDQEEFTVWRPVDPVDAHGHADRLVASKRLLGPFELGVAQFGSSRKWESSLFRPSASPDQTWPNSTTSHSCSRGRRQPMRHRASTAGSSTSSRSCVSARCSAQLRLRIGSRLTCRISCAFR